MADPRFHSRAGPFRLSEVAEIASAEVAKGGNPDLILNDVAPLSDARGDQISFLDNRKYLAELQESEAGACIIHPDFAERAPEGMALLLSKSPYKSYAFVARAFYPLPGSEPGIASSSCIDPSATVGKGSRIEPGAVLEKNVEIGADCHIGANTVVGAGVMIGDHTIVGPNSSLSYCNIGKRVNIYPGVRIGQPGFGFALDPQGHIHVPQLGRVVVGNDVTIGANCTIDRGAGPDTVIGDGTIIDNMVHIAHNVKIGRLCVIAGQVGISGSTELGDFVVVAGQAGFAGHINIGSGAQIGGQCGVLRSVEPGDKLMGTPGRPLKQFFKEIAMLERMSKKGSGG